MRSNLMRYCFRFIICCAIGLLLVASGPSLVAAFWHASHGRVQQFAKFEILVPHSFIVLRKQENDLDLLRARPVLSFSPYQFESIKISPHEGRINLDKWRDAAFNSAMRDGYSGVKAYNLQLGDSPVPCIEHLAVGTQVRTTVLCANDQDIYIEYFGDVQGISDLREFMRGVRRAGQ